jgi:hypothetical protein
MAQTRKEHLDWCKQRAMEYCNTGDLTTAVASIISDLGNDESTEDHPAIALIMSLSMGGHLSTQAQMKDFIEGIN